MPRSIAFAVASLLSVQYVSAEERPAGAPPTHLVSQLPSGAMARMDHTQAVTHLSFSADGNQLLTASKDGTLRLWDTATGKELRLWKGFPDSLVRTALSPDGKKIAAADAGSGIRIIDRVSGKVERDLKGPPVLTALGWTPAGRTLIAAGRGGQLCEWTGAARVETMLFKGKEGSFAALSEDSRLLITSGNGVFPGVGGSTLQVREALGGRVLVTLEIAESFAKGEEYAHVICWAAAVSPDGKYLATSQSLQARAVRNSLTRHNLCLWELATGKGVLTLNLRVAPSLLAFSPDGGRLIYTTAEGISRSGRIWGEHALVFFDLLGLAEVGRLEPQQGLLTCLGLSPNGKTLASAGATGAGVLVWEAGRFQPPQVVPAASGKALAETDLPTLWMDLAGDNANLAYRAQGRLILGAADAVPFLKQKMRPIPPVDTVPFEKWIGELDSEQFAVRRTAMAELVKAGPLAETRLRKAQQRQISQEHHRRLELLLQKIERTPPSPAELQQGRALTVLERIGTSAAKEVLSTIADGAPEARITQEARNALTRWCR